MESSRRIYRSSHDRRIGGVCGGLGEYFGIDPTILRFVFLFGFLMSGSILFWVYLILWAILPEEPTYPRKPKR